MRPRSRITGAPILSVQLTPEVSAWVRAEAKAAGSNVSRYLREVINRWYQDRTTTDARDAETTS